MDHPNTSGNIAPPAMPFFSDFGIQDFLDQELNFDHQVTEMLRGEAPNAISIGVNATTFSHTLTTNLADVHNNNNNLFCQIPQEDNVFNDFNSPTMSCTNNTTLNSFSGLEDDMIMNNEGEDDDDEDNSGEAENSSATATTTTTTTTNPKKGKADRSRTLISERRRRGRMKEKLYALRALVPNITKMDKASIVGDAVLYLQGLQTQAKTLKTQIQGLESSLKAAERCQGAATQKKNSPLNHFIPVCKIIMQMDVLQIEDREFYVKVVSNKGQGVAASLYKALESFTSFIIQNSNLNTVCERFVLTFTLNVGKCSEDMNVPNLKLWITGALLSQGFEFQAF